MTTCVHCKVVTHENGRPVTKLCKRHDPDSEQNRKRREVWRMMLNTLRGIRVSDSIGPDPKGMRVWKLKELAKVIAQAEACDDEPA